MTKKLIVIIGLFTAFVGFAQENTSSPYSFYGIGELKFRGTEDAKATGGLSFAGDSISLNLSNPASYSGLKLTAFGVGGTTNFNKISNSENSEKANRTSIDYIAVGVPIGKFGATFGLMPYSAVGYKIQENISSEDKTINYNGKGNINSFFIGSAYSINKKLSFGVNVNYLFGDISNSIVEKIEGVSLATRELNESSLNGILLNTGFLYNTKMYSKYNLTASLVFSPETNLNATNNRNTATVSYNQNGSEIITDFEEAEPINKKITIPSNLSFGIGISETNKWLIGTEITFKNTKKQDNTFDNSISSEYENSLKYVLGGYYIPKYDSYSNYLHKIIYRAGFRYEKTGLIINQQSINDYGMNFGVGLPLGYSKINIGFEVGKKGTNSDNLIQENYYNLSIGLSLSDKWFRKRKID
jgi:hypothetical protein